MWLKTLVIRCAADEAHHNQHCLCPKNGAGMSTIRVIAAATIGLALTGCSSTQPYSAPSTSISTRVSAR
jgi:hypothetical protein